MKPEFKLKNLVKQSRKYCYSANLRIIMGKPNVAVVCSSNMNRSMEAHSVLNKKKFPTKSFGTGDRVKIPGRSAKEPNVYSFGKKITYTSIQTPL